MPETTKPVNANFYILSHHLVDWFACPLRAFNLIKNSSRSLIHASRYRETLRIITAYLRDRKETLELPHGKKEKTAEADIAASLAESSAALEQKQERIGAVFCMREKILLFVPYMRWDKEEKAWVLYYGIASNSHKRESMLHASFMLHYCRDNDIAVSRIVFFNHKKFNFLDKQLLENEIEDAHLSQTWRHFDVTKKVRNYAAQEKNNFKLLFTTLEQEEAMHDARYWQGCNKQYCESCGVEEQYDIDDIRTIRKSKRTVDELYSNGVRKVGLIPEGTEFETVALRQINSINQRKPLVYKHEISELVSKLEYPRYYLDFEAFNNSIPLFNKTGAWEYIPFLFSLQWQKEPEGSIYTQLWALPPGEDRRSDMWKMLKKHLSGAGSIIVYSSQFEKTVLKQLAEISQDPAHYPNIESKIVDLQELFFNLSLYKPEQKGKISLKTVSSIWLNMSYDELSISEGIAANYYYVKFCDDKFGTFDNIAEHPYLARMFEILKTIETDNISMQDIMRYCKYDTRVMVSLVSLLEEQILM